MMLVVEEKFDAKLGDFIEAGILRSLADGVMIEAN